MNNKLPLNLQTVIHIINNWNFEYVDNHVTATINVYVDLQELKDLRDEFQSKLYQPGSQSTIDDKERNEYIDAINELNLAISELEKN